MSADELAAPPLDDASSPMSFLVNISANSSISSFLQKTLSTMPTGSAHPSPASLARSGCVSNSSFFSSSALHAIAPNRRVPHGQAVLRPARPTDRPTALLTDRPTSPMVSCPYSKGMCLTVMRPRAMSPMAMRSTVMCSTAMCAMAMCPMAILVLDVRYGCVPDGHVLYGHVLWPCALWPCALRSSVLWQVAR